MKKISYLSLIIFILSCAAYAITAFADDTTGTVVRVCILDDRNSVSLSLKGKYEIYGYTPERILAEGPYLSAKVSGVKEGLLVGSREIKTSAINVRVARNGNIYVDGRRFRGDIDIVRKESGKLMVINHLPLDEYLYGVLYHEVSHYWPMEVLKAQAIAARTFALYQIRQSKTHPYDLRSDIYSQVYGGQTSEKWSTTMAVNRTKEEVLTYKGNIFPAYYHATCGGDTEDAANLWNIDLEPLKGVTCSFCAPSPHYRWTKEIFLRRLEKDLKDVGYKVEKISSVTALSKNRSGRVDKIEIKDNSGTSIVLTGKDFRQILGPNDVRSTNFDLSIRWGSLVLRGIGWGHGVGMCQWGAYGMARKGKSAKEILQHYYPGSEISTIDKIKM